MNQLSHYIVHGWPTHRHLSDPLTFDYWNYKSELSIEDGIIFKGDKLVIPEAERVSYTKDLHVGHLGEEKTLLRARQLVFWPNLTNDIRAVVSGCTSCQADRPALQREPMIPHEMPARPWEVVGIDFFEWNGSHYLLIADVFSKFPVIRGMTVTTTTKTIAALKTVFGEYGVPQQIMTDQGPQFTSQEFQEFTNSYEINTKHSSPRYPQSNGFIEAMVKTVKGILTRARDSGTDPQLAMLIYRTTPFKAGVASPSELLNGRRYQALIPMKGRLSSCQEYSRERLLNNRQQVIDKYNEQAKNRSDLQEMQKVWFQKDPNQPRWEEATVVQVTDQPRSYVVQKGDGAQYQRTSRHVRPAAQKQDAPAAPKQDTPAAPKQDDASTEMTAAVAPPVVSESPQQTQPYMTRSGRVSRKPDRLQL
jgi:transposase InsO family protein